MKGASPSVARTLNADGALSTAPRSQVAPCPICGAHLECYVGILNVRVGNSLVQRSGVSLERCTDPTCPNAVPHQLVASDVEQPTESKRAELRRLRKLGRA